MIKDASENEDQQWDGEYRLKKKKGKSYINKKCRKQSERGKYDKTHVRETVIYDKFLTFLILARKISYYYKCSGIEVTVRNQFGF